MRKQFSAIQFSSDSNNKVHLKLNSDSEVLDYQVEMISTNNIAGLLPLSYQKANGKPCFAYDVCGLVPLSKFLIDRRTTVREVVEILLDITKTMIELKKYLLEERCALLGLDSVFINPENCSVQLIYLPVENTSVKEDLFASFVIDLIGNIRAASSTEQLFCKKIVEEVRKLAFDYNDFSNFLLDILCFSSEGNFGSPSGPYSDPYIVSAGHSEGTTRQPERAAGLSERTTRKPDRATEHSKRTARQSERTARQSERVPWYSKKTAKRLEKAAWRSEKATRHQEKAAWRSEKATRHQEKADRHLAKTERLQEKAAWHSNKANRHPERTNEHLDMPSGRSDMAPWHLEKTAGHSDGMAGRSDMAHWHMEKMTERSDRMTGHSNRKEKGHNNIFEGSKVNSKRNETHDDSDYTEKKPFVPAFAAYLVAVVFIFAAYAFKNSSLENTSYLLAALIVAIGIELLIMKKMLPQGSVMLESEEQTGFGMAEQPDLFLMPSSPEHNGAPGKQPFKRVGASKGFSPFSRPEKDRFNSSVNVVEKIYKDRLRLSEQSRGITNQGDTNLWENSINNASPEHTEQEYEDGHASRAAWIKKGNEVAGGCHAQAGVCHAQAGVCHAQAGAFHSQAGAYHAQAEVHVDGYESLVAQTSIHDAEQLMALTSSSGAEGSRVLTSSGYSEDPRVLTSSGYSEDPRVLTSSGGTDVTEILTIGRQIAAKLMIKDNMREFGVFLKNNEFVIGRLKEKSDLVLDNRAVGKVHAKLERSVSDKAWVIRDMHSKNGTYINNIKVKGGSNTKLNNNDTITIANIDMVFMLPPGA